MNCNRRSLIRLSLGVLAFWPFSERTAKAQAGRGPRVSGTVSDRRGDGIPGVRVQLVGGGALVSTLTNAEGDYRLRAPDNGPYGIVFREAKGSLRLYTARQLTSGTDQLLSLTIDLDVKTFVGMYDSLQALETISFWRLDGKLGPEFLEEMPLGKLREHVAMIRTSSQGKDIELRDKEREFIRRKSDCVDAFFALLL